MALVTSFLFQGLSGKLGNVVFKQRRGKTYVDPMPVYNKDRIPTRKELDVRAKFSVAVSYARKALTDPVMHAFYKKRSNRNKTAFGIAFRHAFNNPVVNKIDTKDYNGLPGSKIFIKALDEINVEEVMISIVTSDGVLIEQGNAYLPDGKAFDWTYVATQVNNELDGCKVIAVAKNLPGNEGMLETAVPMDKILELKM